MLAVTGGGSLLLSDLLTVPGASSTVLEARVPYAPGALTTFLGGTPDQACAPDTACDMAMAAFQRALALSPAEPERAFGCALTASLRTSRDKRGTHRAHIAVQTLAATRCWSLQLAVRTRSRLAEERLLRDVALWALAQALGIAATIEFSLSENELLTEADIEAPAPWQALMLGRKSAVDHHADAPPAVLFPGAFNPLHDGHRAMAAHAERHTGRRVAFEICMNNVDKPPLNYLAIQHRLAQFAHDMPVWLTRLPTFVEKARRFPGVTFVAGADTIERIAHARYYGDSHAQREAALNELARLRCRFLVFGRQIDGAFKTLDDMQMPAALRALCEAVPESAFRADVSSTGLRRTELPTQS